MKRRKPFPRNRSKKVPLGEWFREMWDGTVAQEVLGRLPAATLLLDQKRITLKGDMLQAVRCVKTNLPVQWVERHRNLATQEVKATLVELEALLRAAQERCRRSLGQYLEAAVELREPGTRLLFHPKRFFHVTPFVLERRDYTNDVPDRYVAHILWHCGVLLPEKK